MFFRYRQWTVEFAPVVGEYVYVMASGRKEAERKALELHPGKSVYNSFPGNGALIGWPDEVA